MSNYSSRVEQENLNLKFTKPFLWASLVTKSSNNLERYNHSFGVVGKLFLHDRNYIIQKLLKKLDRNQLPTNPSFTYKDLLTKSAILLESYFGTLDPAIDDIGLNSYLNRLVVDEMHQRYSRLDIILNLSEEGNLDWGIRSPISDFHRFILPPSMTNSTCIDFQELEFNVINPNPEAIFKLLSRAFVKCLNGC